MDKDLEQLITRLAQYDLVNECEPELKTIEKKLIVLEIISKKLLKEHLIITNRVDSDNVDILCDLTPIICDISIATVYFLKEVLND